VLPAVERVAVRPTTVEFRRRDDAHSADPMAGPADQVQVGRR